MTTSIRKCAVGGHEFQGPITKGMCGKHYTRLRRTGNAESARAYVAGGQICTVDESHGKAHSKGLCTQCFYRAQRAAGAYGPCAHPQCLNQSKGGSDNYCGTHHIRMIKGLDMNSPIRKWGDR